MSKIIFVSDMFLDECSGGAELTTESIIDDSPHEVIKKKSGTVTKEYCQANIENFWIFGNFSFLAEDVKKFVLENLNYSVIEYDYKYCKFRSDNLHILSEGKCDCDSNFTGKINSLFLARSKVSWWMSHGQREFYFSKFPFLKNTNTIVLSSVFSEETTSHLREIKRKEKNNKWIILDSPSWIKNKQGCVEYAKKNNLEFELVWGLEYKELLSKLSRSKGLIFLPLGKDTCPRITIEAKLLGCETILNENVQHRDEEWFRNEDSILAHLAGRTKLFWDEIGRVFKGV